LLFRSFAESSREIRSASGCGLCIPTTRSIFARAGAGLSKTDHSRVQCRKVDLRARNAERLSSFSAGVRHFSLRRRVVFEKSW
jgi:hypothetical protein